MGYIKLVNGVPTVEKVRRENGMMLRVPECSRTFYFHFANTRERDEWTLAVCTNIEMLRRSQGAIEDMLGKVKGGMNVSARATRCPL